MANRNGAPARKVEGESIKEGSRWLNAPPTSDVVAQWFRDNVKLHEGLDHEDFIGGVVLIKSSENIGTKNAPVYRDVFTPYAKVDTRIDYFWKWCEVKQYRGVIEKVPRSFTDDRWKILPTGFFPAPFVAEGGKFAYNLGCEVSVGVYEPDIRTGGRGRAVIEPAPAVKVVRWTNDPDAFLRCETGAVGRALGMAGMLVLGTGVATAEDILELPGHTADPDEAVLPPTDDAGKAGESVAPSLEEQWAELQHRIESDFPGLADDLQAWAVERKIDVTAVKDHEMRGVVRQAEKLIKKAEDSAAARN